MSLPVLHPSAVIDPVCGMQVNPAAAPAQTTYRGQVYYFCNPHCLQKFQANPEKYLAQPRAEQHTAPPPAPGTEYICPMDPEVVSDRPGPCPKCGMALEPRLGLAAPAANSELRVLTLRLWLSLALGLPLVVNAMSGMVLRHP